MLAIELAMYVIDRTNELDHCLEATAYLSLRCEEGLSSRHPVHGGCQRFDGFLSRSHLLMVLGYPGLNRIVHDSDR